MICTAPTGPRRTDRLAALIGGDGRRRDGAALSRPARPPRFAGRSTGRRSRCRTPPAGATKRSPNASRRCSSGPTRPPGGLCRPSSTAAGTTPAPSTAAPRAGQDSGVGRSRGRISGPESPPCPGRGPAFARSDRRPLVDQPGGAAWAAGPPHRPGVRGNRRAALPGGVDDRPVDRGVVRARRSAASGRRRGRGYHDGVATCPQPWQPRLLIVTAPPPVVRAATVVRP